MDRPCRDGADRAERHAEAPYFFFFFFVAFFFTVSPPSRSPRVTRRLINLGL
jgi:hypothetical protein